MTRPPSGEISRRSTPESLRLSRTSTVGSSAERSSRVEVPLSVSANEKRRGDEPCSASVQRTGLEKAAPPGSHRMLLPKLKLRSSAGSASSRAWQAKWSV